ncbi:threonine-phosphate decarboxylase [Pseudohoeflea suaedae]|nr:threonine-phosphate decarboxylase [Pseudohoeflea suaedae]
MSSTWKHEGIAVIDHGGALLDAIALHGGSREDWLDLSTGISPVSFPLPDFSPDSWRRLPDPALTRRVAELSRIHYGGATDPVITPGSQAAIQQLPLLARLARPGASDVAILAPTYGEYEAAFTRAGFSVRTVVSLDAAQDADAVVLANPNNPDGRRLAADELADFAHSRGSRLTIVDEAFADCHPEVSAVGRTGGIAGLMVLRSFGKFFGLAGVRLGFAFASRRMADALSEALGPWPVSGPALEIAAHAFSSPERIALQRNEIERCQSLTAEAVGKSGIPVVGQTALFVLLDVGDGAAARDALAGHRILARAFDHSPRLLRLGLVANAVEGARLASALKALKP